jgi:predicted aspartyl protease
MPSINASIQPGGPLVGVFVGVSAPRATALINAAQSVPPPVFGAFLIDTGASMTVIDPELVEGLGLSPTGRTAISTPSTAAGSYHFCDQYDVSLLISGSDGSSRGYVVEALPVITTHLRSQRIDGLIGRDLLNRCTFIYNGSASMFTLAY